LKTNLLLLLFFTVLSVLRTGAQQNSTWYFGDGAGLRFNGSSVTALTNGALFTTEGSAAISTISGGLLFYTDGITVWDRTHQSMPNGTGLQGHASSTVSALIIPRPGWPGRYFIFTADASENQFYRGYRYSEVDTALNGGLGDLVSKNTLLYTGGSERMALVKHGNGKDYWLVTRERTGNVFRTFLIDCGGVRPQAVVSATGIVTTALPFPSPEGIGILKASPDGRSIGMTIWDGPQRGAYLYRFNNLTGQLFDPLSLSPSDAVNTAYGLEFSPNATQVYVSYGFNNLVRQYRIALWNEATINATAVAFPIAKPYGMQLGPDGKIYIAHNSIPYVARIASPDGVGPACGLADSAVFLQSGICNSGLPYFPNSFATLYDSGASTDTVKIKGTMIISQDICRLDLEAQSNFSDGLQHQWSFGDGKTDTGKTVSHVFADAGSYTIKLTVYRTTPCRFDSVIVSQTVVVTNPAPLDFNIDGSCAGETLIFHNTTANATLVQSWNWTYGDGNSASTKDGLNVYVAAGLYTVRLRASFSNGCIFEKQQLLSVQSATAFAGADIQARKNSTIQLSGSGGGSYEWSPATGVSDPYVSNPLLKVDGDRSMVLKVTSTAGCTDTDTLLVKSFDRSEIYVPSAFTPNGDGRNDRLRPLPVGISSIKYFRVYDRWGGLVYSSSSTDGWDGSIGGKPAAEGNYVWVVEGVDVDGSKVLRKGNAILIR